MSTYESIYSSSSAQPFVPPTETMLKQIARMTYISHPRGGEEMRNRAFYDYVIELLGSKYRYDFPKNQAMHFGCYSITPSRDEPVQLLSYLLRLVDSKSGKTMSALVEEIEQERVSKNMMLPWELLW